MLNKATQRDFDARKNELRENLALNNPDRSECGGILLRLIQIAAGDGDSILALEDAVRRFKERFPKTTGPGSSSVEVPNGNADLDALQDYLANAMLAFKDAPSIDELKKICDVAQRIEEELLKKNAEEHQATEKVGGIPPEPERETTSTTPTRRILIYAGLGLAVAGIAALLVLFRRR